MDKQSSDSDRTANRIKSFKSHSEDLDIYDNPLNDDSSKVTIGVCCMEKKSQSKEMREILSRMSNDYFNILIFDERMIIEEPVEDWPIVECLMSFHSTGFPLIKAISYVELRKPFMINDLVRQQLILDRKMVYTILKDNNIPVPKHFFVIREPDIDVIEQYKIKERKAQLQYFKYDKKSRPKKSQSSYSLANSIQTDYQVTKSLIRSKTFEIIKSKDIKKKILQQLTKIEEFDDYIKINNVKLIKPFVEKPLDAEIHDIHIYYHSNDGGGCKKLFRKIGNQSSSFSYEENSIRSKGNYIYEEFLATNGFDIKVYTVGEFYAHAEARKSPCLDGVVMRSDNGKEVRYPVCLTPEEKLISNKIVNVFGQLVCGFDLLRANGKSYVCDVNGWSFVKGNQKYYQDSSSLLTQIILKKLRPALMQKYQGEIIYRKHIYKNSFRPAIQAEFQEELRSVVAIFRHGDRTPKQKLKMKTSHPLFLQFIENPNKIVKLKHPKQLTKLLEATRECVKHYQHDKGTLQKLNQMLSVLEKGGHFEGIHRKAQLKPQGPNQILLILKWGGELTKLGEYQALTLGQVFRNNMYPQEKDGLLRLHSTYRHDLKTYSSDEGRCQYTAAAFLKGFLDYEGDTTPILASMVFKDKRAQELLNSELEARDVDIKLKHQISVLLNSNEDLWENFNRFYNIPLTERQIQMIKSIGKPRKLLKRLYDQIGILTRNMRLFLNLQYMEQHKDIYIKPEEMEAQTTIELTYSNVLSLQFNIEQCAESLNLCYKRWHKLHTDMYQNDEFNISKIPDIYDSIKQIEELINSTRFDLLHNYNNIQTFFDDPYTILKNSELLQNFVVPFEHGITQEQKLVISSKVVMPLCQKIKDDLLWWKYSENRFDEDYWKYKQQQENINSPWRHIRTRLYFTSASHMYTLFNLLFYGLGNTLSEEAVKTENINSLQYLSNIVIKLYENLNTKNDDPNRFRLEIMVFDGIRMEFPKLLDKLENIYINKSLNLDQLEQFLNEMINVK